MSGIQSNIIKHAEKMQLMTCVRKIMVVILGIFKRNYGSTEKVTMNSA